MQTIEYFINNTLRDYSLRQIKFGSINCNIKIDKVGSTIPYDTIVHMLLYSVFRVVVIS